MARVDGRCGLHRKGFPHPRGDGPGIHLRDPIRILISPPAWGWPGYGIFQYDLQFDFPTRVGMARGITMGYRRHYRFPHPRGDGPTVEATAGKSLVISPPAWGWPDSFGLTRKSRNDFPTRVGMARSRRDPPRIRMGFPHPRGDGPCERWPMGNRLWISPPAWGWPGPRNVAGRPLRDFPTRVGMARWRVFSGESFPRFPHPRGDGPALVTPLRTVEAISPPAWGWPASPRWMRFDGFDFPTRVGMARIPVRLPDCLC